MTFQRLSGRYRKEAVKYLIREEKDGHVRTASADVHGRGRLCDEPKERPRRRLLSYLFLFSFIYFPNGK